jgi:FOG: CheY-like receiver
MGELWQGIGYRPILNGLSPLTSGEVLLRVGALTGYIGSANQLEDAQGTAKDLISESLRIFESLKNTQKISETQIELAVCYWREGAYDEARVMLKEAISQLNERDNKLKAVALYRSAIVEKLATRYNDALSRYSEAAPLFNQIENHSLNGKFHNGFANLLVILGQIEYRTDYIDRALIEYAAASYHFEQAGHTRYQACVENNLGFLFGTIKKFREAHEHLDRAQALFTRLRDKVHIAQVDDARAKVLLAEGRTAEAEKLARSAVRTLETGGEQSLYAEALITHGMCLARMNRHQDARQALHRAVEVAGNAGDDENAGQAALTIIEELGEHLTVDELSVTFERALDLLAGSRNSATKERLVSCAQRVLFLAGILPTPPTWENFSLKDALRRYEARIIERALKDAGRSVTRAARMLGFGNHTSLIKKLKRWHEDLLRERAPAKERKQSLMFIDDAGMEPRPLTILHVEDNRMVAEALRETLEMEGWLVESLADGATALRLLESEIPYDVLIFDYDLPGMDGLELVSVARSLRHRQHIPIIMLSASDIERDARREGVNAFLRKPEEITLVTETIARLLARKPKGK